ncbi:MAG: thiamine pyrophosphate-binding protein [Verrucomicrobiota bacterium]
MWLIGGVEAGAELVRLLGCGVRQFVVCGGARNAAILEWLGKLEGVEVWSHFEERGAGFFGLGRTMATGEACGVVVTSGTAVAELLPAVVEAYYQGRPLVVISADRPERFWGTGAPQVIEQEGIFGGYAERELGSWDGRRPLHLNVPLEEVGRIAGHEAGESEWKAEKMSFETGSLAQWLREDIFRGLVVLVGGLEEGEREEVYYFCRSLGVPVLADATSGLREALEDLVLVDGDRILREAKPGKVLRLGDVPLGRFWRDLEELPEVEVFSVTRTGFTGLARESLILQGEIERVIKGLGEVEEVGDVLELWPKSRRRGNELVELLEAYPESEPALLRELSLFGAQGDSVFLGNSLPIREWNDFGQRELPVTLVRACRGANGIDGQLSAWLGATAEEDEAWGVFGDVTVLYDLAAPHLLEQVEQRKRVLVVVNNDGGRIFERLPRMAGMGERARAWMRTAHGRAFGEWARMWDLSYVRVENREDFDRLEHLELGTTVVELVPDGGQSELFWEAWKK